MSIIYNDWTKSCLDSDIFLITLIILARKNSAGNLDLILAGPALCVRQL